MRRPIGVVLLLVSAVLLAPVLAAAPLLTTPAQASGEYPTAPEGDPPGANDWECEPTAEHPEPVVLVHGTFGDRRHLLERLSSRISGAGYCVFSLDYGNRGTRPVEQSARELQEYVDRVREATGAEKVSLVGHSQGGMMPRHYIKFLGGDAVVEDLVGLAPSNHGTELTAAEAFGPLTAVRDALIARTCPACLQQGAGSEFLQRLNAGDETPGPVSYTQVTTRYDGVVVPHTSGYLTPGPESTNLTLQDVCPLDLAEHVFIPLSNTAIAITLDALGRDGPAAPDFRPRLCRP